MAGEKCLGEYGDFQMETDHVVGQIAAAIDEHGFRENTLFIVTSDNGCSPRANFKNLESQGHYASAQFRGAKADLWDGGHRVPFIVRWPAHVKADTVSDQLICQSDLMATCADILGATLAPEAGPDSESFLPALKGEPIPTKRNGLVHHSIGGFFPIAMASGSFSSRGDPAVGPSPPKAKWLKMLPRLNSTI